MRIQDQETPVAEVPNIPLWAENYAMVFYESKKGVSSVFSLGRWSKDTSVWRSCCAVVLNDGHAILATNYGRSQAQHIADAGIARVEVLESQKRFRFWFDGPAGLRDIPSLYRGGYLPGQIDRLELDLVFSTDLPFWDVRGQNPEDFEASDVFCNDGRLEQLGNISGTIRYAGQEVITLDNVAGLRDHSLGVRDVKKLTRHIWAQGAFPNGRRFLVYLVGGSVTGHLLNRACIIDGTTLHEGTIEETDGFLDTMADRNRPFSMTITAPGFGKARIEAFDINGSIPLGVAEPADLVWGVPQSGASRRWMNEQRVHWRWDGVEGWGNMERSTPYALEERDAPGGYKDLVEVRR